jgi:hypothetical protein
VAGLALLGLGLRLWGIGFGLPETYHPDEPAYVLQALAVGRGLPGGLTFANPPLYKYLLLAEYAATYAVGRLAGRYASAQAFVNQFRAEPTVLYLEARATSAVLGSLTIVATYLLGATWRSRRAGLIAAGWSMLAYLLVREAHFGVNDALVTLLATLALVFCVRVVRGGSLRDSVLAGALTGLAFTAKYQGLAALVPLALGHVLARPRRLDRLAVALGVMVVSVGLTFPSLLFEPRRVVDDMYVHLYLPGQVGYDGIDPAGGYLYYLKVLGLGVGWPVALGAVAGAAVRWRDRACVVVGSLPMVVYGVLGGERMYFARLLLPALPAVIVLAAVLLDDLGSVVRRRWAAAAMAVPLAAALVSAPGLLDAVRLDRLLSQTDTRTQAVAWAERSLEPGARLAVDAPPLGPPLPAERFDLLVANGWSLYDLPLEDYRARGVQYIVTSSFTAEARQLEPARDAQRQAFYAALSSSAQLLAQFRPARTELPFQYDEIYGPLDSLSVIERPGPSIRVYRLV